jgi:hypothetical protein
MKKLVPKKDIRGSPKLTIEEGDICGKGQIDKQIQKLHPILQQQVTSKDHNVEPYVATSVSKSEDSRLRGYCETDWAGNIDEWKSTSGVCFSLHNNLISWFSKKQNCVALSTAKVEYGTDGSNCSQLLGIKQMISEYNVEQDGLTLYCENKSSINISKNPIQHSRTKHIDVCHHFIRDLVEDNLVTLKHVATENQLVDTFTKTLDASKYETLRGKLGIFLLDEQ